MYNIMLYNIFFSGDLGVNYKITLAGDLGSGKSTVSDLITSRNGAEYYSTGAIVRRLADEHGIDVVEMNKLMETDPVYDKEVDDGLVKLSDIDKNMIIDSRMAWHFVRENFSVYLTTDLDVSAARIFMANRGQEKFSDVDETAKKIKERKQSESKRYKEKYGVDCKELSNYALVIDTTYASPEEICDRILRSADMWQVDRSYRGCFICPSRLMYAIDGVNLELISALARSLECGEDIPEVKVFYHNDDFYVSEGVECAIAYSLCDMTFVPCTLVKGTPDGKEYVRMKNSL